MQWLAEKCGSQRGEEGLERSGGPLEDARLYCAKFNTSRSRGQVSRLVRGPGIPGSAPGSLYILLTLPCLTEHSETHQKCYALRFSLPLLAPWVSRVSCVCLILIFGQDSHHPNKYFFCLYWLSKMCFYATIWMETWILKKTCLRLHSLTMKYLYEHNSASTLSYIESG